MSSTLTPDWWTNFVEENPVAQSALEHFRSIDWTRKCVDDPSYHAIPSFSRILKPSGEDYFFAKTVNTPETVRQMVCLLVKDFHTPTDTAATISTPPPSTSSPAKSRDAAIPPPNPDCLFLLQIGPRGLDGHPFVMHGGFACALLDECLGFVVVRHLYNLDGPERKHSAFTAYLNTTYRAQSATPGEFLVRAWLVKREGRKWILKGQIVDKHGTVCTEAEGLWVVVPRQKL